MGEIAGVSRRSFLKMRAAVGGGLLIGFQLPGCERKTKALSEAHTHFKPNA